MADKLKNAAKAHVRYKTTDGRIVPGATTITGLLNKPFLVTWANRLGLEGIDSSKYTDEAAAIGTLAHAMIEADLQGVNIDWNLYSQQQRDLAENALISFYEWKGRHNVVPILCEQQLVSDKMLYGGTIDCYCILDGVPTLLDFKTSKNIYDEHFCQLAAYAELLRESGSEVQQVRILRVGRDETEGFEERSVPDTRKYFKIFSNLLEIYYLKRELGWN